MPGLLNQLSSSRGSRYGQYTADTPFARAATGILDAAGAVARPAAAMLPFGGLLSGYTAEDIARLQQPDEPAFSISNPLSANIPGVSDNVLDISQHDLAGIGLLGDALDFLPAVGAGIGSAAWLAKQMARGQDWSQVGGLMAKTRRTPQMGITGYHGSPHKFDDFSMEKIGTGEGAQAYGHGLYFAENPGVAGSYQSALSQNSLMLGGANSPLDVQSLTSMGFDDQISEEVIRQGLSGKTKKQVMDYLGRQKRGYPGFSKGWRKYEDFQNMLGSSQSEWTINKGNLYTVDIPDEAIDKMLDWDAPLSEQPELRKLLEDNHLYADWQGDISGEKAYQNIVNHPDMERIAVDTGRAWPHGGDAAASAKLDELGIPGIKYYDGGSRAAGSGTRNFVVFDDKLPTIKSRNGEPVPGLLSQARRKESGILGGTQGAAAQARAGNAAPQQALEHAELLEMGGAPREQIWAETADGFGYGVMRGPDGKLRYEIDDAQMYLDDTGGFVRDETFGGYSANLGDALKHPEVRQAYPGQLENQAMVLQPLSPADGQRGAWRGDAMELGAPVQVMDAIETGQPHPLNYDINFGMSDTAIHELQHGVQDIEDFARGGSPGDFSYGTAIDINNRATELVDVFASPTAKQLEAAQGDIAAIMKIRKSNPDEYARINDALQELGAADIGQGRAAAFDLYRKGDEFTPHAQYNRLAGEAEARAVQARMNMSPAERAANPFWSSYDVPEDDMIVRGLLGQ